MKLEDMQTIHSISLCVALESFIQQIHAFENGWFSAHEANMTRLEAEQIAAYFLYKFMAEYLDDTALNEALCAVRYQTGEGEQDATSNQ